jgi:putative heme-binding domain-containing protein
MPSLGVQRNRLSGANGNGAFLETLRLRNVEGAACAAGMTLSKTAMRRRRCTSIFYAISVFLFFALTGSVFAELDKDDPAAELASFQVAPGFEVSLFASEKDGIVKPIQMRFDSRGRLWVTGSKTYPQLVPGEVPDDKVWILEDSNKDGKVDQVQVFTGGLMIPTGLEIAPGKEDDKVTGRQGDKVKEAGAKGEAGNGKDAPVTPSPSHPVTPSSVYVGEGPKLWLMTDTDGDGVADQKEMVFRGFGTGDNHQNINSFRWSPGGELMFCQGLHAHARIETARGIVALDEAGFWRYRPRSGELDAFYGGQADPQNPWGWVWTDWGQPLLAAGNNGTYFYPLPEMIRGIQGGRRDSIWDGHGRKTSGPEIVGTAHFPDDWQGTLITGGYISNTVLAMRIEDDGAGFKLVDREPLIKSTHASFRPVDVKFGPDGSLYICDWYNPIIGHYQSSFRHPDRDKAHGRIWRVTAKGRPLVTPPPIAGAEIHQLFENLKSPERYVRYESKLELAGRPTEEVVKALCVWAARLDPNDPATEHARYEALGVFEWHDWPMEALLAHSLKSKVPGFRAYAAGVFARWVDRVSGKLMGMENLIDLAADPEARVRLAAVVAAGNVPRGESAIVLLTAANQPRDKFIDLALTSAAKALKPSVDEKAGKSIEDWKPGSLAIFNALAAGDLTKLASSGAVPKNVAVAAPMPKAPLATGSVAALGKYRATPEFVTSLMTEIAAHGEPKRGTEVYSKLACNACHALGGVGGNIGPPLDAIGAGHPIDFIIGATLEPQREVKEGYECYDVTTKDGTLYSGYFVAGTEAERTLRDLATGKEVKLKPEQIAEKKFKGSVMPAGLTDNITPEELRDLIAYLAGLGKAK